MLLEVACDGAHQLPRAPGDSDRPVGSLALPRGVGGGVTVQLAFGRTGQMRRALRVSRTRVPAGTPLRPLAAARAGQCASEARHCACTSSYTFMYLSFTLPWTRRPVGGCGCPAGTGSASAAVFARLGTLPQHSAAAGRVVSAAMGVSLRASLHDLGCVGFAQRWCTLRRLARRPVGRRRPACAASAWKSAAKCLLTA
jgi:hypothetical protein